MPDVPTITLAFAANKSFQAVNPIFPFNDKQVCPLCWAKGRDKITEEKQGVPRPRTVARAAEKATPAHLILHASCLPVAEVALNAHANATSFAELAWLPLPMRPPNAVEVAQCPRR